MELREEIKKTVQAYRCGWVELGRLLNELVYGGDYKDWGFDDFEVYCARELGLNKSTAQKLMIGYNYMKKHQSEKLEAIERGDSIALPSHDTVAKLDDAYRKEKFDDDTLNELKYQAFSQPVTDDTEKSLRKRLSARGNSTPREVDPDIAEKAAVLKASRTLRKEMSRSHFVPDGLRERIERPLVELEALD